MVNKRAQVAPEDLSFHTKGLDKNGKEISDEMITKLREKHGFCLACKGTPVLCFKVTKNRYNPLSRSKEPLTVEGECLEGVCLKCNPGKDPRRERFAMTKSGGSSSRMTGGTRSRKDMHRNLSNGSMALSQSRRDLFRASQNRIGKEPVARDASTNSLGSLGTVDTLGSPGSIHSSHRSFVSTPSTPSTVSTLCSSSTHGQSSLARSSPSSVTELSRAVSTPNQGTNTAIVTAPRDFQRSRSCSTAHTEAPMERRPSFFKPPSQSSLSSTAESSTGDDPAALSEEVMSVSRQASSSSLGETAHSQGSQDHPRVTKRANPASTSSGSLTVTTIVEETDEQAAKNLDELLEGCNNGSNYTFLVNELMNNLQTRGKEVKIVCLEWIAKLCAKDNEDSDGNKQLLLGTNVLEEIVFAMKKFDDSKEIQDKAAAAAAALVAGKQDACKAIIRSGACKLLTRSLKTFGEDSSVAKASMNALKELTADTSSRKAMVDGGTCPVLLHVLSSENDAFVVEAATIVLKALTFEASARKVLTDSGACPVLVRVLQSFKAMSSVAEATVGALRALIAEPSARQSLNSSTASKSVCEVMGKHISLLTLQRDGCAFLCNVSLDEETSEVSLVSHDVMKAIVDALLEHKSETKLVKIAIPALYYLTSDPTNVRTLCGVGTVFDLFLDVDGNNKIVNYEEASDVLERLQMSQFGP